MTRPSFVARGAGGDLPGDDYLSGSGASDGGGGDTVAAGGLGDGGAEHGDSGGSGSRYDSDAPGSAPHRNSGSGPGPGRLHVVRHPPAKLNLTLAVLGRRDDGYHSLHSVMVPLTLGDALTVSLAPAGAIDDSLRISGIPIPASSDNLVLRAVRATRVAVQAGGSGPNLELPPLAARLTKHIPVAAGLGGGSSDAAAAMDAALAIWGAVLSPTQALAVAASLGSDVPFFLARGAAVVTGRGEFVEPLPELRGEPPAILLITPARSVSTAEVFGAFATTRPAAVGLATHDATVAPSAALSVSEALATAMRSGLAAEALLELADDLAGANDLLSASLSVLPELGGFIAALRDLLDRPVGQSGSGPTLWVLYPSLHDARKAARLVRSAMLDGRLPAVGSGEAFLAATSLAVRPAEPTNHGLRADRLSQAKRPRTVHNGFDEAADGPNVSDAGPREPVLPALPVPEHSTTKGDDPR
jgi:4-diphosphocytidyl-2-C-methyl-D-erythritol kinase